MFTFILSYIFYCLQAASLPRQNDYNPAMTSSCFHIHEKKKHGGFTFTKTNLKPDSHIVSSRKENPQKRKSSEKKMITASG